MARSAASIQAEIDAIEAKISSIYSMKSYSIAGRSKTEHDVSALTTRLDQLYIQLDRISGAAPMFVRGVVKGLR